MLKLINREFEKYSPSEKLLFELLPRNGEPIDTETLTRKFYQKREGKALRDSDIPVHGRVIVNGTLKQLIRKIERNKEPFRLIHSGRAGPNSARVWIEREAEAEAS